MTQVECRYLTADDELVCVTNGDRAFENWLEEELTIAPSSMLAALDYLSL